MLKKTIFFSAFILFTLISFPIASTAQQESQALYPAIEPLRSGYLQVSDLHKIYWEVCGNEDGIPVFVLHGGPGGSAGPEMRRFFDPQKYKVILFDQRGAGRSLPKAEWRENTTQLLIEDINKLRAHLGVQGKAILFGGSWGSTLAVAYAEAHPQLVSGLVLRGVFLGSKSEIDHFYHGGTAAYYPENFKRLKSLIPNPQSLDFPRQLFDMTQDEDPNIRDKAIKGWAYYEIRMVTMNMTDELCERIVEGYDMTTFSVLENHYMMNGCFLDDQQLLDNADKIADIPTFIVNGRFDSICPPVTAYELANKLNKAMLELKIAAHSQNEPPILEALVRGVKWVTEQIEVTSGK